MELKDNVHNPHDAFFRDMMENKKRAVNFFKNYLPADILKLVDIKTLQIKKESFIEKELKRFYSDILYQVAIKDSKAYIYLLFEHQSSPNRWMALRLLGYIKLILLIYCMIFQPIAMKR